MVLTQVICKVRPRTDFPAAASIKKYKVLITYRGAMQTKTTELKTIFLKIKDGYQAPEQISNDFKFHHYLHQLKQKFCNTFHISKTSFTDFS